MVDLLRVVAEILAYGSVRLTAGEAGELNRMLGLEAFKEGLNLVDHGSPVADRLYAALPEGDAGRALRLLADLLDLTERCGLRLLVAIYKIRDSGVEIFLRALAAGQPADTGPADGRPRVLRVPGRLAEEVYSILWRIASNTGDCEMACGWEASIDLHEERFVCAATHDPDLNNAAPAAVIEFLRPLLPPPEPLQAPGISEAPLREAYIEYPGGRIRLTEEYSYLAEAGGTAVYVRDIHGKPRVYTAQSLEELAAFILSTRLERLRIKIRRTAKEMGHEPPPYREFFAEINRRILAEMEDEARRIGEALEALKKGRARIVPGEYYTDID